MKTKENPWNNKETLEKTMKNKEQQGNTRNIKEQHEQSSCIQSIQKVHSETKFASRHHFSATCIIPIYPNTRLRTVYTHVYSCLCTCLYICLHTYLQTQVYMHAYAHAFTDMSTHKSTYMPIYISTHIFECMVCTHASTTGSYCVSHVTHV